MKNQKEIFDSIYNDFFGIEGRKKYIINKVNEIEDTDQYKDTVKEISNKEEFLKNIFDRINKLYISLESKDLLKKIIQYMRLYDEKAESNYITFNITFKCIDDNNINEVSDILFDCAKYFNYIDKYSKIILPLYKLSAPEDIIKAYEESGFIILNKTDSIELEDNAFISRFFSNLKEKISDKKITMICDNADRLGIFYSHSNIDEDYFSFVLEEQMPDKQDIYNDILNNVKLSDDDKIKLLDYISQTFTGNNIDITNYKNKLLNYISFNKKIPELKSNLSMEEIFKELNELVGLDNVKQALKDLVNLIELKNKTKDNLKINNVNLHMVFLGNPGTGKTTVARLLSKMLYNLKYIKEDKLIEVTSKDLVAEYVGQTAPKTNAVIEKALGGILFIDEAYSLSATEYTGNSFNEEAVATLIQAMENKRDELVVIFAGYTKEMQDFLDTNSGLVSRIGYTLTFNDYTKDELIQIFNGMVKKAGFTINDDAIKKVEEIIDEYKDAKNFGNARFMRNVFEKTVIKHATNTKDSNNKKALKTITKEDISTENLIKE